MLISYIHGVHDMDNAIKTKLTNEEMNSIIMNALNKKVVTTSELSDGWANTAYSITLNDGDTVILKVAPIKGTKMMRYEQNIMRAEVETLRLVEQADLPVPKVFVYDDSCTLIGSEYFLMERLQGNPFNKIKDSLSTHEVHAIQKKLGSYSRSINKIKGKHYGYYANPASWRSTWSEAFEQMIMDVLADGKDAEVKLPVTYRELEENIRLNLDCLSIVEEPSLVHWDLWDGNIFIGEDRQISGIIDFERALWGDPLMEHYFSHFGRSDAFEEGYGVTISTPNQLKRRALYDLYLDLILWIECTYREYSDKGHIDWAYENLVTGWESYLSAMKQN